MPKRTRVLRLQIGLRPGRVRTRRHPFPPRPAPPAADARAPGGGEARVRRRAVETGGDDPRGLTQLRAQVARGHVAGHSGAHRLLGARLASSLPFRLPALPAAPAHAPRPCPSGGGARAGALAPPLSLWGRGRRPLPLGPDPLTAALRGNPAARVPCLLPQVCHSSPSVRNNATQTRFKRIELPTALNKDISKLSTVRLRNRGEKIPPSYCPSAELCSPIPEGQQ